VKIKNLVGFLTALAIFSGFVGKAWAEPVRDDVQWEQRRERYDGGPIRPGWQLHGTISPKVWIGVGSFVAGYIVGGVAARQGVGWIPFAGPWVAIASPPEEDENEGGYSGVNYALLVIGGLAQLAGTGIAIWGILDPNLYVIYDAPVGSPPLQARLQPGASGSDLGLSFSLRWL